MDTYSTTQATNIVAIASVIVLIAKHFKFDISQDDLVSLIGSAIAIFAIVRNYVNRYKAGDLTLGGFRKTPLSMGGMKR